MSDRATARQRVERFIPDSWDVESVANFRYRLDELEKAVGREVASLQLTDDHQKCDEDYAALRLILVDVTRAKSFDMFPHALKDRILKKVLHG